MTRRVDFALFMVAALENDELTHEAPAIVGRRTPAGDRNRSTALGVLRRGQACRTRGHIGRFGTERDAVAIGDADPAHLPMPEWIDQWHAAWDAGQEVTTSKGARLT